MMYHKELYVFDGSHPVRAVIRNYEQPDFPGLIAIQQESFPPPFPPELWWNTEQLGNHVRLFPEGALCIEVNGQIAGSMTSLLVSEDSVRPGHAHTWAEVTDSGYIRTHDPDGSTLYVADIRVQPSYRKLGLGKWLMLSMYDIVVQLGLRRLLGGGRMPGYHLHEEHMTAEEYLDAVVSGKLRDPIITFMLRCGRTPIGVAANYLEDEESCHYGALMEWRNPFIR
ncbi:Acetyltransferase (GNAT) family protein [compost metagenome]